jgi:hypothetical protein
MVKKHPAAKRKIKRAVAGAVFPGYGVDAMVN